MADFRNITSKAVAISGYKSFYIQKTTVAEQQTTYDCRDTKSAFGFIAKTNPYVGLPNPKECYSNNWLNQNGDDEYNAVIKYEAFTLDVEFYAKAIDTPSPSLETAVQNLRGYMDDFFAFIGAGEFEIYDDYTGIGFCKVRYAGYEEKSFKRRGNWASLIMSIKFKVNDPVTRVRLESSGASTHIVVDNT